ncbi:MAG: LptF/LptG family permease [Crocinitomicaceae bacterium]|jgi:lipopolysaccharide export system permease protein|nr:LptF/LptG family permease [Crocinitomicaceae bacterium]MCF8410349.1 LptF/LptG family permease [Crocinitomicaceae bacterium]
MIKIIDKYIIGKFLGTFFFMLGIIMFLAVVFDVSEKLSEFISNKAPLSEIVFNYYLNFVLFYGNMFSSMIIFLSVIWFTAKMAQETEIIPIWFSGRPITRFMRPYFMGATILMVLSLILNHFIIPRANKVRLSFEEKYYRDRMHVEEYHAEFPNNEVVYFSSYGSEDNLINEFVVEKWDKEKKITHFLKAKTAQNIIGTNKWILTDYFERKIGYPNDVLIQRQRKDTTFQFTIDDMAQRDNIAEAMTFTQLTKHIDRERKKGSSKIPYFEIELHQRTSYPFAAYILTIIGVAVSSQKKRGGIGINIAIGLGIVFIYIFVMKVATVATIKMGFPAYIAVWIPNMIFAFVALFMYRFAQK